MHGRIELHIDQDDKVKIDDFTHIGGSGLGDSRFDSWRIDWSLTTEKATIETLERIIVLLKTKSQTLNNEKNETR